MLSECSDRPWPSSTCRNPADYFVHGNPTLESLGILVIGDRDEYGRQAEIMSVYNRSSRTQPIPPEDMYSTYNQTPQPRRRKRRYTYNLYEDDGVDEDWSVQTVRRERVESYDEQEDDPDIVPLGNMSYSMVSRARPKPYIEDEKDFLAWRNIVMVPTRITQKNMLLRSHKKEKEALAFVTNMLVENAEKDVLAHIVYQPNGYTDVLTPYPFTACFQVYAGIETGDETSEPVLIAKNKTVDNHSDLVKYVEKEMEYLWAHRKQVFKRDNVVLDMTFEIISIFSGGLKTRSTVLVRNK